MKDRLTKLFTTFLAVVLLVGMSPAAATTAYAASWGGISSSVSSDGIGNRITQWWNGLFNKSDKNNNSTDKSESKDAVSSNSSTVDLDELDGSGSSDGQLSLTKSITHNSGDNYTIKLEAYATGEVKTTTQTKDVPTDIVLVLDQSGSMAEKMYNYKETYDISTNNSYYVKVNNEWKEVRDSDGGHGQQSDWYYSDNSGRKQYVTPRTSKDDTDSNHTQFYTQSSQTRLEALKAAVNTFVTEIQNKAANSEAKYRVSVVGFGTGSYTEYGYSKYENTELFIGSNQYNYNGTEISSKYSQAFQDMSTKAGQDNISASINALDASGATCADLGMEMANKIFDAYPLQTNEKRNRVVVMFTDGEPSKWSGFNDKVANNAIGQAKTSKNTYKASVYTIGVLDGANPSDTTSKVNKYMNYVSSNFPNATGLNQSGAGGDVSKGFYKKADDAAELKNAFESISSSIESGSTSVTLNQDSVLRDVISDDFSLPANADKNSIVVKTADYAGKNNDGTLKWSNESIFGDAKVDISGKTINVSNFNYNQLFAATVGGNNQGKKLIVEIPVTINRNFGANNVLSNASAGIYPLADSRDPYITVESPEGSHPTEYGVKGTEQWINPDNSVTIKSLIGYTKDGDFEYKPDGVKNKYVDIVYTIKDKQGNTVGTYTVEHGKTTGTYSTENTPKLDVDTVYDVEVTVTPIAGATDADKACGRQAEPQTYKTKSYVYINSIAKAFVIDFGKPVTYTKDQVFSKNQLVKESEISIKDASNTYGNLTLNDDKSITYKLNKFMDGIDTYVFNVACKAPTQTVKMVPASSVYYEDNFGEVTDAQGKVTNSIISYDDNWKTVTGGNAVTSINGEDPVGYDSAYEGNTQFSSGSAHKAEATDKTIKATFKFTGSGIDLYGYTDNNTGRMRIQLYKLDSNDKRISSTATYTAIVDTKYNSGKVYQTPLFSYKGDKSERYEVVVTVGKGSTIYLDALRVYYPIGKTNENYTNDENNIEYVDIRDQIFNPEYFNVSGELFVDEHADGHNTKSAHIIDLSKADDKTEYSTYGRKREVAIAPGGTVTLSGFKQGISVKQIGMRTNAVAPEKFQLTNPKDTVDINGKEINLTSATDMYYNVTVNKNGELVITNNTNYIITLTNLKLK